MDIGELMAILGYTDPRSIIKWCNSKNIPLIKIGLKKYILSQYLTQYIDNQLVTFVQSGKSNENNAVKPKPRISNTRFKPDNEIVSKYLAKYESSNKSKTT